jgi:hypothetical protein
VSIVLREEASGVPAIALAENSLAIALDDVAACVHADPHDRRADSFASGAGSNKM